MSDATLTLVLGDQLTHGRGALRAAMPGQSTILMAEVAAEAAYVPHNRHKIVLIFSAMRHFRDELREAGFEVIYYDYEMGVASLQEALERASADCEYNRVTCCEPGEYRVRQALEEWSTDRQVALDWRRDDRFLCSTEEFHAWADGRKQLRMEYFYREMRRRYGVLLTQSGEPEGGRWNYDRDNRSGWRGKDTIPRRPALQHDTMTGEVLALIEREFPDNPGDLSLANSHFMQRLAIQIARDRVFASDIDLDDRENIENAPCLQDTGVSSDPLSCDQWRVSTVSEVPEPFTRHVDIPGDSVY